MSAAGTSPSPARPANRSVSRGERVALVHDWLTGMRGGEKVLDAICELYPDAPLFSLVHVPGAVSPRIEARRIVTAFTQRLPGASRFYRQYLPLFPAAVELFDLDGFDLVISTSHCAVKSVVKTGAAVHVCFCHSPMRYAWDQFESYFGAAQVGNLRHRVFAPVMAAMARWDRATAGRVDRYVANSRYVAARIRRYYNRGSTVVYPPVDTAFYRPPDDRRPQRAGLLVVSALVPYKRLETAIDAARLLGERLSIVGTGPELSRLQGRAGDHVTFLGWRSNEEIRTLYQQSAATLLPGIEDFGLVPVEAQACGCPVVALSEGGAAETVIDGETGVLVADQTDRSKCADAFAAGIARLGSLALDPDRLRQHAESFSRERFLTDFRNVVDDIAPRPPADDAARRPPPMPPADDAARRTPTRPPAAREDDQ